MSNRVNINLVTSKAQPSIKARQLYPKVSNNNDSSIKNDGSTIFQSYASSNQSHKFKSVYSYQPNESDIVQQTNSSQVILNRANDFNNNVESPINHQNLQAVNQHIITHFQKQQPQIIPQDNNIYSNYLFYKEKIEKALTRSAENMSKYNRSISVKKSLTSNEQKSEKKQAEQKHKLIDIMHDQIPSNPLQKIRTNRFQSSKLQCQTKTQSSNRYAGIPQEQKTSYSEQHNRKDTMFTFDDASIKQDTQSAIQVSPKQNLLQQQLIEKEETIKQLECENIKLLNRCLELSNQVQYHQASSTRLAEELQQAQNELKKNQPIVQHQDFESFKKQIDNLQQEKHTLSQQKSELENILKEILLQNEKDRFRKGSSNKFSLITESQKSTLNRNRQTRSIDNQEDSYNSDLAFVRQRAQSNKMIMNSFSNDVSMDVNRQTSFDLSHSTMPNKNPELSCIQDSWMSASFQTNVKDYQDDSKSQPMNVSLNLQLLPQFNDCESKSKEKGKKTHHNQKFQQPFSESTKSSVQRRRFGIKDKENKHLYN